ncbi:MAG: NYN domain-containing protein, partial [bacterium]
KDMGWQLDFRRFRIYLKDKFKVEKAYIFIGYVKKNESLYTNLRRFGYNLIFKPTLEYHKNKKFYTKGNVDAELVLHTMIEYNNFDKAVLVSGDGDFHCLIEYLNKHQKLLVVVVPDFFKFSALLRKFMKKLIFLNKLKNKLEYKKRGINLRTKP